MKLKSILAAHAALSDLISLDRQNKLVLHSSVRIRLAGAVRKTRPTVEDFSEQNNELVMKYGTQVLDKDQQPVPGQFVVQPDSTTFETFRKEKQELLDTDIELTFTPLSTVDLFGKTEDETKQNQIPLDLLDALLEVGLLKE